MHRILRVVSAAVSAAVALVAASPSQAAVFEYQVAHTLYTGVNTEWMDMDVSSGRLFAVAQENLSFGRPPKFTIVDVRTREVPLAVLELDEHGDVVFSAKNDTAYIAQPDRGTILAVDASTATVRDTILAPGGVTELALDPVLDRLYGITAAGNLIVVDTETDSLTRIVSLSRAERSSAIEVDPVTHEIFVDRGPVASRAVEIVDALSLRVVGSIPVTISISDLVMAPSSDRLYVLGSGLLEVDTGTRFVLRELSDLKGVALKVDAGSGSFMIVDAERRVTVADVVTGDVQHRFLAANSADSIEYDPVNAEIYVGGWNQEFVQAFVLRAGPEFATTSLGVGTVGAAYFEKLVVTGDPRPEVVLTGGSLPPGLSLSSDRVSGVPTAAGTYAFTLVARNGVGPLVHQRYTIVVAPSP